MSFQNLNVDSDEAISELNAYLKRNMPPKKKVNWIQELKAERNRVLDEAIIKIKGEMRLKPTEWHRGYYSAITQLEIMKNG